MAATHGGRVVKVNSHRCKACGDCVQACPNGALKMVGFRLGMIRHEHVSLANPSRCVGCGACVKICNENALTLGR